MHVDNNPYASDIYSPTAHSGSTKMKPERDGIVNMKTAASGGYDASNRSDRIL